MKVVAIGKIKDAQQRYPAAHNHLSGWYQVVSQSDFHSDEALKATFGNIRGFNHEYKFPVSETTLQISVLVNFESQVALIEGIKPEA